jgi:hypothetical protein
MVNASLFNMLAADFIVFLVYRRVPERKWLRADDLPRGVSLA